MDEKIPVWGRSGKRVFQAEGEAIPNVLSYLHFIHQYRSQKKPDRPVIIWLFVLSCKLKQVVAPITATAPHVVYLLGHINMVSGILAIIWRINLFSALFSVPLRKGVQRQFAFTWDRQQHIFAVSTQGSVKFSLLFQNIFRRDLDHLGTPQNIILIYYFDGIELPEQGVGGGDANLEERIEKTDSDCLLWWIVSGVAKTTDPSNPSLISLPWEVEVPQRPGRCAHPSAPSWVESCICVAQAELGPTHSCVTVIFLQQRTCYPFVRVVARQRSPTLSGSNSAFAPRFCLSWYILTWWLKTVVQLRSHTSWGSF